MTKKKKPKPVEEQFVEPIREEMKSLYMLRGVPDGFWVNASEDFNSPCLHENIIRSSKGRCHTGSILEDSVRASADLAEG